MVCKTPRGERKIQCKQKKKKESQLIYYPRLMQATAQFYLSVIRHSKKKREGERELS